MTIILYGQLNKQMMIQFELIVNFYVIKDHELQCGDTIRL